MMEIPYWYSKSEKKKKNKIISYAGNCVAEAHL